MKKNTQGWDPRTHKTKRSANRMQKSSAYSKQRRESVMAVRKNIGVRDKAAIRRTAVLVTCASNKRMRRRWEVETPTCPEFGEEFVRSGVKKMMEGDVQGHCLIKSVAVNKRMLWPSRQRSRMRLKLNIVITTKVKDNFNVRVSCQRVTGAV